MQHTQFNYVWVRSGVSAAVLLILTSIPALSASMAGPSKPDPLLDGGPPSACAAGVDYAAGSDANGNKVVPADVDARPVPVPDEISIPVGGGAQSRPPPIRRGRRGQAVADSPIQGGGGAYVSLDGRRLEPLINPKPCR
jgi:hypothetical protein